MRRAIVVQAISRHGEIPRVWRISRLSVRKLMRLTPARNISSGSIDVGAQPMGSTEANPWKILAVWAVYLQADDLGP